VNIVNPTDVRTLKDGRIMVSWAIDENAGYELTAETVFGMTSTNSQGRSVISYVGFTSNLQKTEQELNNASLSITLPIKGESEGVLIFAPDGTRRQQLAHGLNIINEGNKVSKVYHK
jgi:alpha-D-xyloside xylohydrolase